MVRYWAEFPSVVSECSCEEETLREGGREGGRRERGKEGEREREENDVSQDILN